MEEIYTHCELSLVETTFFLNLTLKSFRLRMGEVILFTESADASGSFRVEGTLERGEMGKLSFQNSAQLPQRWEF